MMHLLIGKADVPIITKWSNISTHLSFYHSFFRIYRLPPNTNVLWTIHLVPKLGQAYYKRNRGNVTKLNSSSNVQLESFH